MANHGLHKITQLRRNWLIAELLADAVIAGAVAVAIYASWFLFNSFTFIFLPQGWWLLLLFCLSYLVIALIRKPWKISEQKVASFLNQNYAQLQESAELLIKPTEELSLLQRLQSVKTSELIESVPPLPRQFLKRFLVSLWFVAIATAVVFVANGFSASKVICALPLVPSSAKTEKLLPEVSAITLTIIPPAHTRKPVHQQEKFNILTEEGAVVQWSIKTNAAIKKMALLFNEHDRVPLKPNSSKTERTGSQTISKPGFYQVEIDGKLSDLYQVEVIKDAPPQIRVKTPKPYTYIDGGEKPSVTLSTTINDDYGVTSAHIHATVAKGSGEAVKFKEYQFPFSQSFQNHARLYDLKHVFDLPKLDMEPGDELYFFIEAQDNHLQKSRTDVFKITIQDTAALLSMTGIVDGTDIKPEYFRSQRQIIIDTEKLIKMKDSLSKDAFNNTSGNIGIDQKMLRLRYGKFLGEEDESNVGGPPENDELAKAENFSNAKMILDAMTDKHDNAEDATYLEPSVKAQLKATLTEMWSAELRLRINKPQEALPFEYKALRLLKDLQQKSRAYVAKTTYKSPPLKLEKRLTGDLAKVEQPLNQQTIKPLEDQYATLKDAIQVLEQVKLTGNYTGAEKHTLQMAKQQLSIKASAQPRAYLKAVSAMNRILATEHPTDRDLNIVEAAVQKILPAVATSPQHQSVSPDMGLSQFYYQNLKRTR